MEGTFFRMWSVFHQEMENCCNRFFVSSSFFLNIDKKGVVGNRSVAFVPIVRGWARGSTLYMINRGPHRVDAAGRGHDQGSRPLWVSMPSISFIYFSLALVLIR